MCAIAVGNSKPHPNFENVILKWYHKGELIRPNFINSNSELIHLFPSKEKVIDILIEYNALGKKLNTKYEIKVSEDGIEINLM